MSITRLGSRRERWIAAIAHKFARAFIGMPAFRLRSMYIPSGIACSDSVIPLKNGIQVTDRVRHTVGERYPGYGNGNGPQFSPG